MRDKFTLSSSSDTETAKIGEILASFLEAGDVLSLNGDLGAGKTIFTKGIAAGLGIEEMISSPTYTLVMEHENQKGLPLFHFDAYQIGRAHV